MLVDADADAVTPSSNTRSYTLRSVSSSLGRSFFSTFGLNDINFGNIFFLELCCGPLWKGFPPPLLLTNVGTYALVLPPLPTFCRTILCYFSVDLLSSLLLNSGFLFCCQKFWSNFILRKVTLRSKRISPSASTHK